MKNILKNTVLVILILVCIAIFVLAIANRNKSEIWFRNYDQDSPLLLGTIKVNAGSAPNLLYHPSHGTYIIYSLALRAFEYTGLIPASSFDDLQDSDDPLMLLPEIFYKARWISISLCVLCALVFGAIFLVLFRSFMLAVVSAVFLLFSNGLFIQALLIRSELPSGLFILLSILFIAIEYKSNRKHFGPICLVASGLCLGLSVLSKIHAIPAILFVMVYLFLSVLRKERSQPHKYSSYIYYSIAVLLFCGFTGMQILKAYEIDGSNVPVSLIIFLTATIIFALTGLFSKIKKLRVSDYCFKFALLFVGFLASFYLSFTQLNFYKYPSQASANYQVQTYEKIFTPISSAPASTQSARKGTVLKQVMHFYNHYTSTRLDYIAIALIVAIFLLGNRFNLLRCLAMLSFAFGIMFCLVSSLRWFGAHYLIYSDMFIIGALILLAVEFNKQYQLKFSGESRKRALYIFNIILCVVMLASGAKQFNRTMKYYKEWHTSTQNNIAKVCSLGYEHQTHQYRELMVSKYGSTENIMRRICNDPYLNGTDRGINLREKRNVSEYIDYFEE